MNNNDEIRNSDKKLTLRLVLFVALIVLGPTVPALPFYTSHHPEWDWSGRGAVGKFALSAANFSETVIIFFDGFRQKFRTFSSPSLEHLKKSKIWKFSSFKF